MDLQQVVNELYVLINKVYMSIVPSVCCVEVDLKVEHFCHQRLNIYSRQSLWNTIFYVRSLPMTKCELQHIASSYYNAKDILAITIEATIKQCLKKMFAGVDSNDRLHWLIANSVLEASLIILANPARGLLSEFEVTRYMAGNYQRR